jgi:hypothetical protein
MIKGIAVLLAVAAVPAMAQAQENIKLPAGVTPEMRAACEADVRRLCVDENPTVPRVKACVAQKFFQLGRRCQMELASTGFSR